MFVAVWVTSGLVALWWMARHGYRDPRWILLAIVLGPAFAAAVSERYERSPRTIASSGTDSEESDRVRVLVGLDGSAQSDRALGSVARIVGTDRAWLLLVRVVGFDQAEPDDPEAASLVSATTAELTAKAEQFGGNAVVCTVAAGDPADTILLLAEERDVDLIAVGRHGSGLSKAIMGNVADAVLRRAAVPVMIIGTETPNVKPVIT